MSHKLSVCWLAYISLGIEKQTKFSRSGYEHKNFSSRCTVEHKWQKQDWSDHSLTQPWSVIVAGVQPYR